MLDVSWYIFRNGEKKKTIEKIIFKYVLEKNTKKHFLLILLPPEPTETLT